MALHLAVPSHVADVGHQLDNYAIILRPVEMLRAKPPDPYIIYITYRKNVYDIRPEFGFTPKDRPSVGMFFSTWAKQLDRKRRSSRKVVRAHRKTGLAFALLSAVEDAEGLRQRSKKRVAVQVV